MSKMKNILRGLLRRPKPFRPHQHVTEETFTRVGRNIEPVDPQVVASAAGILESAIAMTDQLPPDAPISLVFTQRELNSFVCYMRQLDAVYRKQAEYFEKNLKVKSIAGNDYELEKAKEAAQVSPERYAELTGHSPR